MSQKQDRNKYMTPPELYKQWDKEFDFDHDPCPIDWQPDTHEDGLTSEWGQSNFVNPPYGRGEVEKWIVKADREWKKGKLVVMLINAITDTVAFHKYIYEKDGVEVRFLKGRIRFIDPERPTHRLQGNSKPSMLVIWRPQ